MKFNVYGQIIVGVTISVEAEDAEAALDEACEQFDGLQGYAGNGGTGKLIGTSQRNVRLDVGDDINFTEAEQA